MQVLGIDHVQLAMPEGREAEAVAFYQGVLGIHPTFRPATKAHPALLVDDLKALLVALREAGARVTEDEPLDGCDRAYAEDPFGNRIELLQRR